eukprot:g20436.t1
MVRDYMETSKHPNKLKNNPGCPGRLKLVYLLREFGAFEAIPPPIPDKVQSAWRAVKMLSTLDHAALDMPLMHPGVASRFNPAKAAVGVLGAVLMGAGGWVAAHTNHFLHRDTHRAPGASVMATSSNGQWHAKVHQDEAQASSAASAVKPNVPGPAQVVPPPSTGEQGQKCLFAYGPSGECLEGFKELTQGAHAESGRVYGARLHASEESRWTLATPTGDSKDVIEGHLLCFPAASFPEKLRAADELHSYDTFRPNEGVLRRGELSVVKSSGQSVNAVWYYVLASTGRGSAAPPALLERLNSMPGMGRGKKRLVLLMTQLGDFDSIEYAQALAPRVSELEAAGIAVQAFAIGNEQGKARFCEYTGFPADKLVMEEEPALHRACGLYGGLKTGAGPWPDLILMCAGIGSPGTLGEVFRGYLGDKKAPQIIPNDKVIKAPPLPPIQGSFFKKAGGEGFQRPMELATVRLANMAEVLGNWRTYVPRDDFITQRGGTFLLDADDTLLYSHRDPGILGFSETMGHPLKFLDPFLAESSAPAAAPPAPAAAAAEKPKKKGDPLTAEVSARICKHMNEDHADANKLYASKFGGVTEVDSAVLQSIDAKGMDLAVQSKGTIMPVRILFDHDLVDSEDAHQTLIAMIRSPSASVNTAPPKKKGDPLTPEVSTRICKHMNEDHSDAVVLYAKVFGGASEVDKAQMKSIDAHGMDLTVEHGGASRTVRVVFDHPLADSEDAHQTLIAMVKQSRAQTGR